MKMFKKKEVKVEEPVVEVVEEKVVEKPKVVVKKVEEPVAVVSGPLDRRGNPKVKKHARGRF